MTPVIERPTSRPTRSAAGGQAVLQAAGWIEPAPYPIRVTALADGIVEAVHFLSGSAVGEGDVLATLVADDARLALDRARAAVGEAEASVAAARADVIASRETLDENVERIRAAAVAKASAAEIAARLELAKARLDEERARLVDDEYQYELRRDLRESGSISEAELVAARAGREARRASVQAAERQLEVLQAEVARAEAESLAASRALVLLTEERRAAAAAEAHLAMAKARLAEAVAAEAEADLRLARTVIRAPSKGVVMHRYVEPGSRLMSALDDPAGARVVDLYDPAQLQVRVDVPLAEVAKLQPGMPVEVIVDVLPNRTFRGELSIITGAADIQKNTLEVKVALLEVDPIVRPEMLARARFLSGGSTTAAAATGLYIPGRLAERVAAEKALLVVTGFDGREGTVTRRSVVPGEPAADGWLEVESGLNPGDLIITTDHRSVRPGSRVVVARGGEQ